MHMALGVDTIIWCNPPSEKEDSKVKRHAVDLGVEPRLTQVNVCMSPSLCLGMAPPSLGRPAEMADRALLTPLLATFWSP